MGQDQYCQRSLQIHTHRYVQQNNLVQTHPHFRPNRDLMAVSKYPVTSPGPLSKTQPSPQEPQQPPQEMQEPPSGPVEAT